MNRPASVSRRGRCLLAAVSFLCVACATPQPIPPGSAPVARELGPEERAAFADLLRIEDSRSYDAALLERWAASPSAAVRARAALALARLGRSESAALASGLLADPDSAVAATAAFALGEIGDTAAVPALTAVLVSGSGSRRPTVEAEAAHALGKIPGGAAQTALLEFLAGAEIGSAPSEPVGSALLGVWRFSRPANPEPIARWASAADAELRWRAAYALTRRADPRNARRLLQLATDADPRVRSLAVRGITGPQLDSAAVSRGEALPLLYRLARDPDYATRINATRSLGTFPSGEVTDTLRALLAATDSHLALAAMESLGRLAAAASGAAAELETIAHSPAAQVFLRRSALESLALVAPARGRAAGVRLSSDPAWRLRAGSAVALARAGGLASAELRGLIEDPDSRVAAAALQAAIDAGGDSVPAARSLVLEQLADVDPVVRATALGALARMRDPSTLPLLLDAYQRAQSDSINDAALAALDALAALKSESLDPGRAFLARFPRSPDHLVRRRVAAAFGAAATAAWGDALPVETTHPPEVYRTLVDRWEAAERRSARQPEAVISTARGDVRIRLFGDAAPLTSESFLTLARRGYFDGQEWPRVVPNFVVQGGDPRGDTSGGPGYTLRDEVNRHRYLTGTLGMALSGPDTGGSQFFLTHSPQPHLDGIYTVFGEVIEGYDVLQRILPGDAIRAIRVID